MDKQENQVKNENVSKSGCPICNCCKSCGKYIWALKRRYKILLILLLLLAGGVYFALHTDWQQTVRLLVHKYGTEAVGTSVDIGRINVSLLDGKGGVSNITVANPKGYSSEHIIKLGNVSVAVDIQSLTKDTVVINEIRIDKPQITYEILDMQHNNVNDIMAHLQKDSSSSAPAQENSAEKQDTGGKNVAIRKVVIADGQIAVVSNLLGSSQSLSLALPMVTVNNIGTEKQGVTIEEGLSRVFQELLNSTKNVVSSVDLTAVTGAAQDLAAAAVEQSSQAITEASKTAEDAVQSVQDNVKGLADGVGSLFK